MSKADERRKATAEKVLDVAERQIAGSGMSGLAMRDLANEADCSVGTLYNLFEGLDGIILRVNSRTLSKLDRHLCSVEAGLQGEPPVKRLVALALAYTDFVSENWRLWSALFEHQMPEGKPIPEWHLKEHFQLFRHIVEPLSEMSPRSGEEDLLILSRNLYSAVHGMVSLGLQDRMGAIPLPRLKEQIKLFVESFTAGYAARAAAGTI